MARQRLPLNPLYDYAFGDQPVESGYIAPLAPLDSLADIAAGPVVPRRKRTQNDKINLTPDEEQSLLSGIISTGGSALKTAGDILDTPGSVVRGLIAGDIGRAFGGIFDPSQRVQAEEITGLASDSGDDWLDKTGKFIGNTAASIALDPLTYMTFGASALGKAGRLAKSADLLTDATTLATRSVPGAIGKRTTRLLATPDSIIGAMPSAAKQTAARARWDAAVKAAGLSPSEASQLSGERLGGLFGFGLPGMNPLATYSGPGAVPIAKALDKVGNAVRWSAPGRSLAALMDAKVMGAKTRVGQENAAMLYHALPRAEAEAMQDVNDVGRLVEQLGLTNQEEGRRKLTALLEAKGPTPADSTMALDNAIADIANGDQERDALARALRTTHDDAHARSLTRQQELGVGPGMPYQDPYANYMTRHLAGPRRALDPSGRPMTLDTQLGEEMGRKEFLGGAKGGTNTLRTIVSDADVSDLIGNGGTVDDVSRLLESKYGNAFDTPTYQTRDDIAEATRLQNRGMSPDEIEKAIPPRNRFAAIADMMAGMPEEMRLAGGFANHPVIDFTTARVGANRAIERGNTVLETLAQPGVLQSGSKAARIEGSTPLHEVLQKVGIRQGDETQGALRSLAELLDPSQPATGESIAQLKNMRVAADVAADLTKINERFTAPAAAGQLGKTLDSITNLWKSGVTAFPAFHARNFGSGQVQAALNFGPSAVRETRGVKRMMKGKDVASYVDHPLVVDEAARRGIIDLDPHTATNIMRELVQRHSAVDRYAGEVAARSGVPEDLGGRFVDYSKQFVGGMTGDSPTTVGKFLRTAAGREEGTTLKPFTLGKDAKVNIRGVGDTTESTFAPLAANEMLGNAVETMNRVPSWIALTRNGVDPTQAKRLVDAAQVVYSGRHFTPFEQQVLGRAFPFYKFSKGMTTHTLKTLAEKPGGALAQTIKATGNASDDQDMMLPDYVKQTLAIPIPDGTPLIGPEVGGAPRYLTGFGLMHEQDPFGFLGGGLQGAGLELLSRLNPYLKAPIEYSMGRSAFQRGPGGPRAIEDQDPLVGRLLQNIADTGSGERTKEPVRFAGSPIVEAALANSPLSRALSTARTLTDPRKNLPSKLLNTLTGARLTDVSEGSQQAMLQEAIHGQMKGSGARTFENVYFPKDQLAEMLPDERLTALRLQALAALLADRERKAAKRRARTLQPAT